MKCALCVWRLSWSVATRRQIFGFRFLEFICEESHLWFLCLGAAAGRPRSDVSAFPSSYMWDISRRS